MFGPVPSSGETFLSLGEGAAQKGWQTLSLSKKRANGTQQKVGSIYAAFRRDGPQLMTLLDYIVFDAQRRPISEMTGSPVSFMVKKEKEMQSLILMMAGEDENLSAERVFLVDQDALDALREREEVQPEP